MKTTPLAREQKQRRQARAETLKRNAVPLGFYLGAPIYSYSDYELQKAKHEIREKVRTEASGWQPAGGAPSASYSEHLIKKALHTHTRNYDDAGYGAKKIVRRGGTFSRAYSSPIEGRPIAEIVTPNGIHELIKIAHDESAPYFDGGGVYKIGDTFRIMPSSDNYGGTYCVGEKVSVGSAIKDTHANSPYELRTDPDGGDLIYDRRVTERQIDGSMVMRDPKTKIAYDCKTGEITHGLN